MQKKMTMCKKDDRPPQQKSTVFTASKVGLSLDICPSRKILKRLLQNIYLMLDLLYHKRNTFIMTVADGSIF